MNFAAVARQQKCYQDSPAASKMRVKFLQRLIRDNATTFRSKRLWFLIIAVTVFAWRKRPNIFSAEPVDQAACCEPIDVVYTWVNGSDPEFIKSIQKFTPDYDQARFDDKNELKYSLRSLEAFAPWVRHVYIVTNGQIPYWLNMACERVTIISHAQIAPENTLLPTFSSSTIETFIHRIPSLSKKFLYLNDDIFLGAPLYPEDLFTSSEGTRVYTAWTVPDCTLGCPWVYVGDGSCDAICNIEECQFDGGDCQDHVDYYDDETSTSTTPKVVYEVPKLVPKNNITSLSVRYVAKHRKPRNFDELLKKHPPNNTELKSFVDQFNNNQKRQHSKATPTTEAAQISSSKDIYAQNLIHTNRILNSFYGYRSRKVLAHVGFLLDRDYVDELLKRFYPHFELTANNRFRHPQDVQFAFAYYHFLMSEARKLTVSEIFDELDTDNSSTWSDREIRTLLARIYPLPLDWAIVRYFEQIVVNCSRELGEDREDNVQYTTLVYERYEDSNIPRVTKRLVTQCSPLTEVLLNNFSERPKYKFNVNQKTGMYSNFKMLTSNMSEVVDALDELRKNPKKFNCINDNLDPAYPDENQLIKLILEDFYLSFFPRRSQFELPDNLRNRFTHIDDYLAWKQGREFVMFILYVFSAIMCAMGLKYFCCHKAKYARKFIPYKCCDI
ncbi:N-acetylglucosamine-1-phosphotransferase subunits alpha/beta [Hermetia illucens]|uniref:N-acetylglucosamine-1-phosphotransferase subunits alpha/beta n=1 Tax=Hermetia illucens TaxID=343691 RepID=UPI0018CC1F19|nr:N-acetylglucosamine-1-phosphotransferase subunits alpha/beta [Hermetia illucens]